MSEPLGAEAAAAERLRMERVSKSFGATVALENVEFAVRSREVHALVGENGAGKSTLMKVLSGAVEPDSGSLFLDGRPFKPRNPLDARMAGVGMIYQELSLALHMTVAENIMLGMEPARWGFVKAGEVKQKVSESLKLLEHLEIDPDARVSGLSVANQQIVEIARAMAVGCRILALDEPTSSLSHMDVERLFKVIEGLKEQGPAIVYISHFLEEVFRIADRFTVLRDGRVAGRGLIAESDADMIIGMMVGRKVDRLYIRSGRVPGETILELEELAGEIKPVSASLELRQGEVLGIAGLVGAGRTELLRAVFGLDKVKRGLVKVAAYVGPGSPALRWRQGVGMLSEDRKEEGLALSMSVADNLTMTRQGFFVSPGWQDKSSKKWIDKLDIRCQGPRQKISELSGGNQQKAAIARLLHHDADALLLDEPTRGIDVASKAQVYELIDELAARGKAVLMVSGYLPELLGVCDRIAVMCRGRLGPARPADELDEQKLMLEAAGQGAAR